MLTARLLFVGGESQCSLLRFDDCCFAAYTFSFIKHLKPRASSILAAQASIIFLHTKSTWLEYSINICINKEYITTLVHDICTDDSINSCFNRYFVEYKFSIPFIGKRHSSYWPLSNSFLWLISNWERYSSNSSSRKYVTNNKSAMHEIY